MKKKFVLGVIFYAAAVCSNGYGQVVAPPGAGDKNLSDTGVKARSVELERAKRDANKPGGSATTSASAEDKLAAKYDEIKTDYEQIQLSQDAVVKIYQGIGKIDYAQIGKSALEINRSAARLNANLFPPNEIPGGEKEEKAETKKDEKAKAPKSVRDLIVDLDNAVGSFATSPMFQNLRTADAATSAKASLDLEKIIELSASLNAEAEKMSKNN